MVGHFPVVALRLPPAIFFNPFGIWPSGYDINPAPANLASYLLVKTSG